LEDSPCGSFRLLLDGGQEVSLGVTFRSKINRTGSDSILTETFLAE
jgi:hypothetical protein